MVLRKKEVYTLVTPIPHFIPRQLALDILHSHSEVITLNPLVIEHKAISPPRHAATDEYYSTWYEITQRIQYVPGVGKLGSGKISFTGCFHDMPWGLQTHTYAPASVELRTKYSIRGNQPGIEPPEQREMGLEGLGVPQEGLYLREDIEIKCNIAMVSFVKAQLKAANKEMVARIIKKSELLDAGVLKSMMQDGKLKTINPLDRSNSTAVHRDSLAASSNGSTGQYPMSPNSFTQPSPTNPAFAQNVQGGGAIEVPKGYEVRPMELPGDSQQMYQSPNPQQTQFQQGHGHYNPYGYQQNQHQQQGYYQNQQAPVELGAQPAQVVELGTGPENQRYAVR